MIDRPGLNQDGISVRTSDHLEELKGKSRAARRAVLVGGTVLAACAALSVHVFMLEGLHVPYPYDFPRTGPATWLGWPLLAFAGIHVHLLLAGTRPAWGAAFRGLVVFLLLAGLKEDLVRAWLMGVINSNPPTLYPVLQNGVPRWVLLACASIGCGAAASFLKHRRGARRLADPIVAACVVGVGVVAASFGLDETWGRLLSRLSFLNTPSRWNPPYDWHIILPAYVTAIEPAIAGTALGLLTWRALPAARERRFACLVLLIVLIKGHLVEPFLNILYAHGGPGIAMLSVGQFTLEGLALAVFVTATVEVARNGAARDGAPG